MFKWKLFQNKWLAVGWLLFITILFFLPGSSFPKQNWFSKIYIDKWVHTGVFAVLLFLWRSAFELQLKYYHLLLLIFALLYGFTVELVQKQWVPNRDFDLYDIMADMAGAILGLVVWFWFNKKNRPL